MCVKVFAALIGGLLITGCATSAPDIPTSAAFDAALERTNPIAMRITRNAWNGLAESEKEKVRSLGPIQILEPDKYGFIVDAQSVDQSTPGTSGGAALGGAIAGSAYIDRSFRGGNYSALSQLAIGLAGAAVGSSLDSKAQSQFSFRYTIKTADGEFKYADEVKSTAFRHSLGVCVLVDGMILLTQQTCNQTAQTLRDVLLK